MSTVPSWGADDPLRSSNGWIRAFDFSSNNIQICNGNTGDEVVKSAKEIMQSFGEGARAIIVFKWDKINGHAIVAECREKGIVNFGDPQWGERAVAYKLKLADLAEKVIIFRVDNLEFTDVVKRCCKNRE